MNTEIIVRLFQVSVAEKPGGLRPDASVARWIPYQGEGAQLSTLAVQAGHVDPQV